MLRWIVLVLALGVSPLVASQDGGILELPTVTVVGADTLFLQPPAPRPPDLPARFALDRRRLTLPEPSRPRLPSGPSPSAAALRSTGQIPQTEKPDGASAAMRAPGPLAETGPATPQFVDPLPLAVGELPLRNTGLLAIWVPGEVLRSEVEAVRALGPWELSAALDLGLADGWVSLTPSVPNFMLGQVEARRAGTGVASDSSPGPAPAGDARRAGGSSLGLRLAGSAGAYQSPGAAYLHSLGLAEDLALGRGRVLLAHATEAAGLAPAGSGRVGLLGQRLSLDAYPGNFLLHAGATAYLRGTLDPQTGRADALVRLAAGYRAAAGTVGLAASGSLLYRDGEVELYPEAGLQLAPWDGVLFQAGGSAFLSGALLDGGSGEEWAAVMPWPLGTLGAAALAAAGGALEPILPLGMLSEPGLLPGLMDEYAVAAQATAPPGTVPLLQPQHGYAVRARLLFAPGPGFTAKVAAEYLFGSVYDGTGGALTYRSVSRITALAELSAWLMRFGDRDSGLEATVRGVAYLPAPPDRGLLEDLYGQRLEGELRLAFPNSPLRIIMGALWGEVPAGLPAAALLSPWESFSGLAAAAGAEYRLGRRHALRAGCEARWHEPAGAPELRFVAGYRYQ
jgi:hypothetical protein